MTNPHVPLIETIFDGLIGPTHHYGGLGVGNIASQANRHSVSHPRAAALQGLAKMEHVCSRNVPQFFFPPPKRPNWSWLKACGFHGDSQEILTRCYELSPSLLSAAYSSSFMWMANAATIAPATDTADGRLHIVPANLCSSLHRGQEAQERTEQFHALLQQVPKAHIHAALPPVWPLRDEGAANHMRLSCRHSSKAMHVFVHGPDAESSPTTGSIGRQSRLASNLIAQTMRLPPESVYLAQQTSRAIQSGVFHNDVIATSHGSLLLLHEFAFENQSDLIHDWQSAFRQITGLSLSVVVVSDNQLPLAEAVRTYLFNSQLIDLGDGAMELICPEECRTSVHVQALIPSWIADPNNPIQAVSYLSLQQSMSNGGGPACLRLRVPMLEEQLTQLPTTLRLTTRNVDALKQCIETWYPETLTIQDLARSDFAEYAHRTVDAIHEALSFRNQSSNS